MKQLIHTEKQYNKTQQYFINYINKLLTKRHIINKSFLKEIQYDLINTGYIKSKNKYKFLLSFLKPDKNHSNINITDYLYSLELFKKRTKSIPTLEKYFI
jgi:poly(3-hydroxyalkanoate) synthetase